MTADHFVDGNNMVQEPHPMTADKGQTPSPGQADPVAWRVLITGERGTMFVYTEVLPYSPLTTDHVRIRREPEALYVAGTDPAIATLTAERDAALSLAETARGVALEDLIAEAKREAKGKISELEQWECDRAWHASEWLSARALAASGEAHER